MDELRRTLDEMFGPNWGWGLVFAWGVVMVIWVFKLSRRQ